MKKIYSLIFLTILTAACEKDELHDIAYYECADAILNQNSGHPKRDAFLNLTNEIVSSGVPGMMLTVHDDNYGCWSGATGFADLKSGVILNPCNFTRVGSTVKTFTAVVIFMLQEDGLLNVDKPITQYLSQHDIRGLKNADRATVRQLLQHSSGIYNYILNAQFQTASLNNLTKVWHPDELLSYARGQNPDFEPGSNVKYSNTNYILLGMIIERTTGKPFYKSFEDRIFKPLGMKFTRFAAEDPVPAGIIRGYVDFYSNFNLINATTYSGWDYFTADGGLLSNSYDLNVFLTNLLQGNLLSQKSLNEMLAWQAPNEDDPESFKTYYGLGIFKIETPYGAAYIHSGDAIGYYASMVYFPDQRVTISWAVNANYGKVDELTQTKKAMTKIFKAVLE